MLARIHSAATLGLDARILDVEVDVQHGLPRFTIVGLPDTTVREARERVRSALKNAGLPFPAGAVTVNLAPADFRKSGAALDLAVAVGLLWTCGVRPADALRRVFVGELGLGGEVRATRGALCLALASRDAGFGEIVLPAACASEAAAVEGLRVVGVRHLREAVEHLLALKRREPEAPGGTAAPPPDAADFSELRGQAVARRAAEIAAAGGHHLLLAGPPGGGKTMLARRLPGILPPLTRPEAIEVTRVHSVAGTLPPGAGLVAAPPFRAPHHGISAPALVGGGARPVPGEISLAHRGALFLDELAEFRRDALESIRQPLEERRVRVVRVGGACDFPCDVLLVAAMNPCPCGFLGDARRACTCAASERLRYGRRLSGPLLDRIDLRVAMPPVPWRELSDAPAGESSAAIRERVAAARRIAAERRPGRPEFRNADLTPGDLAHEAALDTPGRRLLESAITRLTLSVRAIHRALRVARTIADLEESRGICGRHLSEALALRGAGLPASCPSDQVDTLAERP